MGSRATVTVLAAAESFKLWRITEPLALEQEPDCEAQTLQLKTSQQSLGAGLVLRPHTCRAGLPHTRVTCHLVTPTLERFLQVGQDATGKANWSANGGNILINQGPHGDESVSNASHFLPRILSPTTQLGKTESSVLWVHGLHWTSRAPSTWEGRGKDVGRPCLPGKKDAPGPRVRRCAGRSPPGPPSSPEASRKPVLSQTTAPSLGELWSRSPNKARALSFYDAVVRNCFALGLSKEKKRRRKKEGGEGLGKMNNAIVFGHQDRTASRHYPLKRRNETALFNWGPEDQNR